MKQSNSSMPNPHKSDETRKILAALKETQRHPKYPSLSQQFQELQVLQLIDKISQPNLMN